MRCICVLYSTLEPLVAFYSLYLQKSSLLTWQYFGRLEVLLVDFKVLSQAYWSHPHTGLHLSPIIDLAAFRPIKSILISYSSINLNL